MTPFAIPANHTQGALARGGRLVVSPSGLEFTPHRSEQQLGAEFVSIPAWDVRELGVEPRSFTLFDGGLRRRLRVTTSDGRHLFVVSRPAQVIERIRDAWSGAGR